MSKFSNAFRNAVYAASSAIFLFGSGYACPPPDHVESDTDGGGGGGGSEPENEWEKFLDRSAKCIELEGKDCHGYPGRGEVGRSKGDRFPNFMALTCDEDGDPWEFAEVFKLKKDGTPKYKSIIILTGHDR